MKKYLGILASLMVSLTPGRVDAQLSANIDKFLGNITTSYQVDYGDEKYYTLWNQITPENESKWGSIEGQRRGVFDFSGCDRAYKYAREHGFPFKFHCLIWGAQYPDWMNRLSTEEQYEAIVEWFDAVQERYPDLEMIDVVNEAISGHQPAPYRAALGGEGRTGYDWIIKAFEMAHERWPNAILIYNDYNTFQWQRTEFIDLVRTLRDAGAPIDAYGCQSHDLTDMNFSSFKSAMTEIQTALKMPMYSTEYDIGTTDDTKQKQRYSEQIPFMWEADYCAGVTLWGYIYGKTWTTDGNSGLIRNRKDRPAMTWLREYMQTEEARTAKSPFPGMHKEASVYVKPASISVTRDEVVPISVNATLATKQISRVDLYVNDELLGSQTSAPYSFEYTPATSGRYELRAVVTADDGAEYIRHSGFTAYNPRSPFAEPIALPGIIEAENFDCGPDGIAYHDSDTKDEGNAHYRTDAPGVDIVACKGGYALGYNAIGEWYEYTVDVQKSGVYAYEAVIASGTSNASVQLSLSTKDGLIPLTDNIVLPCYKESDWETYSSIYGRLLLPLQEGRQIIRMGVNGANGNIDKIKLTYIEENEALTIDLVADAEVATVGEATTLTAILSEDQPVASVRYFVDGALHQTVSQAPFACQYTPQAKGIVMIQAEAIDALGKVSPLVTLPLKVNPKRTPYKSVIALPGLIQAENFDRGGEGFTFHDADSNDEGDAKYRTDNEGVDLVKGNGGTVLGYTAIGDWTEYSVDVTTSGVKYYTATVSSGTTGSGFSINLLNTDGSVNNLATIYVPQTGNSNWDAYTTVTGELREPLPEGEQILRIIITGNSCNIDKVQFDSAETAIRTISDEDNVKEAFHNLYGQRVGTSAKGLLIGGGKRIFVY